MKYEGKVREASQYKHEGMKVMLLDFQHSLLEFLEIPPLEILSERQVLSRPGLRVKAFPSERWENTFEKSRYKNEISFQDHVPSSGGGWQTV